MRRYFRFVVMTAMWFLALAASLSRMNVRLPASINPASNCVHVNGGVVPFSIANGMAVFDLPLTAGASTTWTIV